MFESIPQNTVTAASANCLSGGSAFCGPDIMTAVEMMLVKDYDDQLKSAAAEMKMAGKVKKAYRAEIEKLNKLLTRQTKKVDVDSSKKKDEKDCTPMSQSEIDDLNTEHNFVGNTATMSVETQNTSLTGEDVIEGTTSGGQLYVPKEQIEARLEIYKSKLESVNEQSEIMSLGLQTLTQQRKSAFETVSNIIKKQEDGVATIIRNIS